MGENARSVEPSQGVRLRKRSRITGEDASVNSSASGLPAGISPTLMSNEPIVQKRGRGRPRTKPVIQVNSSEKIQLPVVSLEPETVLPKRKPGRPRKIFVPSEPELVSEPVTSEPPVAPKRRGRPKLVRPEVQTTVIVPPVAVVSEPSVAPKRRGRPKLVRPDVPVPVVVSKPESEEVVKRGRGRTNLPSVDSTPIPQRVVRPAPQMVTSSRKREMRGNKIVTVEKEGWGIYNREASYLVGDFFTRRTDAITALEREERRPWSQIKHDGKFVPVKIRITLDQSEIVNTIQQFKVCGLNLIWGQEMDTLDFDRLAERSILKIPSLCQLIIKNQEGIYIWHTSN